MSGRRALKWAGGIFAGLIVVLVLVVALFDWNWLRDPIARKVSSATGRPFAINGDLSVHLSLHPRVIANDIVLGNAQWAREPNMAEIKRLDFRFDLLRLLGGMVAFREIALSEPRVALEVSKDDVPNWVFDGDKSKADKPLEIPEVGALTIDRGTALYLDPRINTDFTLEVRTLDGGNTDTDMNLEVAGKGRFKGLATTVQARGGALLSLRDASHPYPVKASATLGATKASIDGMLLDPLHLKGEELNFTLEGADLAQLYPIIGVPIPPTPAYKLAGYLDHAGDVWTFRRFKGKVGQSDVAGDFSVDRGKSPQFITAKLVSQQLRMQDLGGFVGGDRGDKPPAAPPPADKVLPAEPFSLEKLKAANADVTFRGEKIITDKMPLEKMSGHLTLENGLLKLAPLDFSVAGGNLVSQIQMDGRQQRIVTRADVTAKGLDLARMFPESKLAEANAGMMGGHAKLTGTGNSLAQMLGTANGEAGLIMDGGSVSELLLRLAGLDIANSVIVFLGGDQKLPIQCMVSNFKAVNGDFQVEALYLDTPKVEVTGSGDVNFADESLRLRLVSKSKGFSLASLRGPIVLTGTLKKPAVRPEMGNVAARGALAIALGAVTAGLGALLPLLEFGTRNEASACTTLMNQAKADTGVKQSDMKPRNNQKK